jgi:hypothetical protein
LTLTILAWLLVAGGPAGAQVTQVDLGDLLRQTGEVVQIVSGDQANVVQPSPENQVEPEDPGGEITDPGPPTTLEGTAGSVSNGPWSLHIELADFQTVWLRWRRTVPDHAMGYYEVAQVLSETERRPITTGMSTDLGPPVVGAWHYFALNLVALVEGSIQASEIIFEVRLQALDASQQPVGPSSDCVWFIVGYPDLKLLPDDNELRLRLRVEPDPGPRQVVRPRRLITRESSPGASSRGDPLVHRHPHVVTGPGSVRHVDPVSLEEPHHAVAGRGSPGSASASARRERLLRPSRPSSTQPGPCPR